MEMKISSEDFFNRFFLLSLLRGMEQTSEGGTETWMPTISGKCSTLSLLLVAVVQLRC